MERTALLEKIRAGFRVAPVVALLGPRQCGKTTLAKAYAKKQASTPPAENVFDLESVADIARLESPLLALQDLRDLVVIDEIQRRPGLFPTLRVLVDRPKARARFLVLGSASRDLIRQSSETLAGRVHFIEVTPFDLSETAGTRESTLERLWLRGGFPRSYLAASEKASLMWREDYIRTFLERDVPALGIQVPALTLRRFWTMLTHYHGQSFNASEIGKTLGFADTTAKRYLDLLAGTFMVRRLAPWFANIQKRQIKLPKVYFRDSGILHQLLGINSMSTLRTHPKMGALWEGFALEQILRANDVREEDAYFWGVHAQAELDLVFGAPGRLQGFEFKFTDAPKKTSSMQAAIDALGLRQLTVIVPGKARFRASKTIEVVGLETYVSEGSRTR